MAASAFHPKRGKRFYMYMSEKLHEELTECSRVESLSGERRSMSEIAHVGVEIIVKQLQKQHKKEGK